MADRAEGFYWVRVKEDDRWILAEWTASSWHVAGSEYGCERDSLCKFSADNFAEIGEQIERGTKYVDILSAPPELKISLPEIEARLANIEALLTFGPIARRPEARQPQYPSPLHRLAEVVGALMDALKWHLRGASGTDQERLDLSRRLFERHIMPLFDPPKSQPIFNDPEPQVYHEPQFVDLTDPEQRALFAARASQAVPEAAEILEVRAGGRQWVPKQEPQPITDAQKNGERWVVWYTRQEWSGQDPDGVWITASWFADHDGWSGWMEAGHRRRDEEITHYLPLPPDIRPT